MSTDRPDYLKVLILFLVFAIIVLTAGVGTTIAKYTAKKDYSVGATNLDAFCFSSDLAEMPDENGNPVQSVSWNDATHANGVRVRLYNYEKSNSSLVSGTDITYSVSVSGGDSYSVSVLDKNGDTVAANGESYVLPVALDGGEITQNYQDVIVVCDPLVPTSDFTVTINSTEPYQKTLSVTFTVDPDIRKLDYSVTDHGRYDIIVIHSNGYSGDLNIKWDTAKLAPDNTSHLMTDWVDVTSDGVTLRVESFGTYELVFFEDTVGDYTKEQTFFEASDGLNLTP